MNDNIFINYINLTEGKVMLKKLLIVLFLLGLAVPSDAVLNANRQRREYDKFVLTPEDKTAVRNTVAGGVAEGAPSTSAPIPVGGVAESTVPTEVSDGEAIGAWFDTFGKLLLYGANQAVGAIDVNPVAQEPIGSGSVVCIDETLDASPTSATCTLFIGDKRSVTLLLNAVMDWTDSDPDLDLDLNVEVSGDNSTFYNVEHIIDKTGVDSPVTSTLSLALSDAETDTTHMEQYYLPQGFTAQYLKVTLTATNSDADDTVVADLLIQYQK